MSAGRDHLPGLFIVFEGPDGSGKTTQSQLLLARLLDLGHDAVWTREPGGTRLGELIREVILHDSRYSELSPRVEALLLSAARSQHVEEVIRPALANGKIVICDRFMFSTTAYQGAGSGLDLGEIEDLNRFTTGGLLPDAVVLLDMDVELGIQRKHRYGPGSSGITRMELRGLDFHSRVRRQFLVMAEQAPDRWLVLDGRLPVEDIGATIWRRIEEELREKSIIPVGSQAGRLV